MHSFPFGCFSFVFHSIILCPRLRPRRFGAIKYSLYRSGICGVVKVDQVELSISEYFIQYQWFRRLFPKIYTHKKLPLYNHPATTPRSTIDAQIGSCTSKLQIPRHWPLPGVPLRVDAGSPASCHAGDDRHRLRAARRRLRPGPARQLAGDYHLDT